MAHRKQIMKNIFFTVCCAAALIGCKTPEEKLETAVVTSVSPTKTPTTVSSTTVTTVAETTTVSTPSSATVTVTNVPTEKK